MIGVTFAYLIADRESAATGESGYTERHQSLDFGIEERHLRSFIVILIVHEVDDVHDSCIYAHQPFQIDVVSSPNLVEVRGPSPIGSI